MWLSFSCNNVNVNLILKLAIAMWKRCQIGNKEINPAGDYVGDHFTNEHTNQETSTFNVQFNDFFCHAQISKWTYNPKGCIPKSNLPCGHAMTRLPSSQCSRHKEFLTLHPPEGSRKLVNWSVLCYWFKLCHRQYHNSRIKVPCHSRKVKQKGNFAPAYLLHSRTEKTLHWPLSCF